jgi:hypothetical protein
MKAIVSLGVIALVAIGIFAAFSLMQRQETDKLVQADGNGNIHEKKREIALTQAIGRKLSMSRT